MRLVLGEGIADRPPITLEVYQTGWELWPIFSPHHYLLGSGPMAFSTAYVGFVDGEPVAHLGMSGKSSGRGVEVMGKKALREARACRLVIMPEWQGAGLGMRFLNALCQREVDGDGFIGSPTTVQFHTSHPALMAALKRDQHWLRVSKAMYGNDKKKSNRSLLVSGSISGKTGFGGHLRGVTGWRYKGLGVEA